MNKIYLLLTLLIIATLQAGCSRDDEGKQEEYDYPYPTEDLPSSPPKELPGLKN